MAGVRKVIVVGAGLAGLCCARTIQRAGHEAVLYETSDGVGGRVRTDVVDGFRLDRGFQVLFTAYPALRQELDFDALHIRAFDPGAIIYQGEQRYIVSDPLRDPARLLPSALAPLFPLADKLRVARLVAVVRRLSVEEIFALPDTTMEAYLREFGFTPAFLDNFIRPFYGGIFLETGLATSARMFLFVYKMLAEGLTAVPESGMGALGEQIASDLAPGTLHLNASVRELVRSGERVTGVRLEDGTVAEADAVVVAIEADKASRLTGLDLPVTWRTSTDVTFAVPDQLYSEKLITLFTDPKRLVNNTTLITNVAPSYAPPGSHLLTATVLGNPALSDAELAQAAKAELAPRYPESDASAWRLLRVYRVTWAQYAQTSGFNENRPPQRTAIPGLILAGEIAVTSSLDGALKSGQRAAALALSAKAEV